MTKMFLSVAEIVKITGWSKSTVYKLIKSGDLESINIPSTPIRIPISSFNKLVGIEVLDG